MASIFRRKGAGPWLIHYYDQHGRRRERSSRTTDYRAAERIAQKLEADVALRREGVVDARHEKLAEENRKPLAQHLQEYLQHCRGRGVRPKGVESKESILKWMIAETRASRLSDVTVESVERALASFWKSGRSPRTVNTRREVLRAFGNWCRKTGRLESNPLEFLSKLDENRDRRRMRRPLTDDELARLLKVADERGRKVWYLAAALAGLRRSELERLTWGSIDLESGLLTIRDGKAKREDVVPLHPELLEAFKAGRPTSAKPADSVFPTAVTNLTRQHDFERAGIDKPDAQGRIADLHALRATLGTRLARAGIPPQIAQRIMRHADYRTTLKHYTMLSHADTTAAMQRLPGGLGDSAGSVTGFHRASSSALQASENAVSASPGQAAVCQTEKVEPQRIPQHSEHDPARSGASTCDERSEVSDDDLDPKSGSQPTLRDGVRRPARMCSMRGARRKNVRNELGTDCSIQLSYGRLAGQDTWPSPQALQWHRAKVFEKVLVGRS
jgi:integrase